MKEIVLQCTLHVPDDQADNLKRLTHHVDELLDLDEWPEIRGVSDVTVEEKTAMSRAELLRVFQTYVDIQRLDVGTEYVYGALLRAGLELQDIRDLGMGYIIDAVMAPEEETK